MDLQWYYNDHDILFTMWQHPVMGRTARFAAPGTYLLQPDRSMFPMSLRPRGHSFDLPRFKYDLTRKSFIFRSLYEQR